MQALIAYPGHARRVQPVVATPLIAEVLHRSKCKTGVSVDRASSNVFSKPTGCVRLPGLGRHRSRDGTNQVAVTRGGSTAGHLSRLPTGCRSTSRTMNPSASLTKPFTRPSTLTGAVRLSANWWAACAPGAHCAFPRPGLDSDREPRSSIPRSTHPSDRACV